MSWMWRHGDITCKKWIKIPYEYGTIMGNRSQFLKGLLGGDIGFINVYAPNDTKMRTQLWGELLTSLSTTCQWIISGDFNFVEHR